MLSAAHLYQTPASEFSHFRRRRKVFLDSITQNPKFRQKGFEMQKAKFGWKFQLETGTVSRLCIRLQVASSFR